MAEQEESAKETSFVEQIRKAYGYDVYTESALARLAARYEPAFRMEQITRTSTPRKEPEGWRDQFMRVITSRGQKLLHRRDWRSRSNGRERRPGHNVKGCVASGETVSANKSIPIPALHLGKPCSVNPVPNLKGLSTIQENVSTAIRRVPTQETKQKKLKSGSKLQSSPKKKQREKLTYPASFQSDHAVPSLSPFFAAQNEVNPTCRPSALERLVLKGELLLSSLLRPDPSAENFGFQDQDPLHKVVNADHETENAGGRTKVLLLLFYTVFHQVHGVPSCQ